MNARNRDTALSASLRAALAHRDAATDVPDFGRLWRSLREPAAGRLHAAAAFRWATAAAAVAVVGAGIGWLTGRGPATSIEADLALARELAPEKHLVTASDALLKTYRYRDPELPDLDVLSDPFKESFL